MLYHYTTGSELTYILAEKKIAPVPERPRFPEQGYVWLTKAEDFDPMRIPLGVTLDEYSRREGGLYRFELQQTRALDAIRWPYLSKVVAMPWWERKNMERTAEAVGADINLMYGTLKPVAIEGLKLQKRVENRWMSVGLDDVLDDRPMPPTLGVAVPTKFNAGKIRVRRHRRR